MSNQSIPSAPPYWGTDYTQQWTPQPPPPSGPMPQNLHFNPDTSSDSQQYYNLHTFYANANLPGLGGAGATNTFPPPPFGFPGTFPSVAAPPPFANMPNLGYPLIPLPPNSAQLPQNQPSMHEIDRSTLSKPPDAQPVSTTNLNQDLDREEGELTDIEGPATAGKSHPLPSTRDPRYNQSGSHRSLIPDNAGTNRSQMGQSQFNGSSGIHDKAKRGDIASTIRHGSLSSELEEGEASPEPRASSRASGSPYNPSLPNNVLSPSISKSPPEAMKTTSKGLGSVEQPAPASAETQGLSSTAVSLTQLRVQAQGALLSLAPHSIRYSELVGEGINPIILKQLYEEVGIKVPNSPPSDVDTRPAVNNDVHSSTNPSVANEQAKQPAQLAEPRVNARQMLTPSEPSSTPPKSAPDSATKPMERKEVIARMLAAKAAKSSPASTLAPQTVGASQNTPVTAEKSTTASLAQDPLANEKENRLKEKNKAQTELARQRIEQLKKQGLTRNFQKSQLDSDKEQTNIQELPQPQTTTIVQHPLPERPPLPVSTSLDQIPGLFMTEQALPATNGLNATSVQEPILESGIHSRSSQRKRPRASDFDDDPIPVPKRTFSNGTNHQISPERLVIDISDDEFYDDDDVSMDVDTTSTDLSKDSSIQAAEKLLRSYPPAAESLPHRPATSQSYGLSSSSTPSNYRNSEQDDLRKKDLEIQAMHRRIAELEQRKKAKLASRTQSPRTLDLPTPDMANMPAPSLLPALPIVPNKNVEHALASMDIDGLRKMKSKILRMQEIEAGIPSLDAVLQKTELKLVDARTALEELVSELTKGKDGRQHLLDELNALKSEGPVMSLDDVNAALITMESKEEFPVEVVQGMLRRLSIPELQQSITTTYSHAIAPAPDNEVAAEEHVTVVPDVLETDAPTQEDTAPVAQADSAVAKTPPIEGRSHAPNVTEDATTPAAPVEELTDTSMSDDSSSSMDESSDESDSDSGSLNEEMLDALDSNVNQGASVDDVTNNPSGLSNEPEKSDMNDEPLSEHQIPTTQPTTDEGLGADSENLVSRDSPVSDAYEPPEPEESANTSDSSYSPPPSPDFHSPAPHMEVSGSSEDQSQEAGEPLIKKVQELDFQQPSQFAQIGPLDNTRRPEDSHRKLTPYTSPLKLFKAYRYHPNFNDNVAGGYRSLTYSHNIDPLKHLCPYETSGGVCNDRSCEFQHFRDMALSDDKILIQMGSLREGKTTEESDKYVAGLKEAINDMRRDKVKDFITVASEIVAYRRRFLQDPTRVLAL
ncbi:hypothetical protein BDW74DRAFT_154074 [Aspergillus multicolor]|uniref:uncharacterized protein n=1 Tax=Aspergillus multicolor TaxID=41759 RepID=UPI003CCE09F3